MYETLEVLGPEHEFSIVDETLRPLSIVDDVIKELRGRIANNVTLEGITFGQELQSHVAEFKANVPFTSPCIFEETMYESLLTISELLQRRFHADLLGLGMHPLLELDKVKIWSHWDRVYRALGSIFNLRQHGWLNIQSFQLNIPYSSEEEGVRLLNTVSNLLPYLPAISAASPIYEAKLGEFVDNRLFFYKVNQKEVPSITGDIVPEYITSFDEYREVTIDKYSRELKELDADPHIIGKEWLNSRGAIFRFDRRAIEIRVMDEQDCIKSDVALSCFIRAALRGLLDENVYLPHEMLVDDLNAVMKDGLKAMVRAGTSNARDVCSHFYDIAVRNATEDEKKYLWLVKKRIAEGNLSDLVIRDIVKRSQKTSLIEAIHGVYATLKQKLRKNEPYT